MLYVTGFNTFPVFAAFSVLLSEPEGIVASPHLRDPVRTHTHFVFATSADSDSFLRGNPASHQAFYATLSLLVSAGVLLTYSQFLCAAVSSALTTSLVNVGKSVFQTTIGFFVFGGVRFSPVNVSGIAMNTLGACLYSYVKYVESSRFDI